MTMLVESTYMGKLVLPNGKELFTGEKVKLNEDEMANVAVSNWIGAGLLIEAVEKPKVK